MIVWIRVPSNVTISYRALAEWKQEVGMPLNGELKPEYIGKAIEIAYFASEEDMIMFRLKFGL